MEMKIRAKKRKAMEGRGKKGGVQPEKDGDREKERERERKKGRKTSMEGGEL